MTGFLSKIWHYAAYGDLILIKGFLTQSIAESGLIIPSHCKKNLQSASILSIWKVVFKRLLVFLHTSTIVLSLYSIVVKEKLQEYCAIQFSRSGLNQMWILQNLESISFTKFNSIYMLNIHSSIKSTFVDIIDNCFSNKTWSRKFTYPVID